MKTKMKTLNLDVTVVNGKGADFINMKMDEFTVYLTGRYSLKTEKGKQYFQECVIHAANEANECTYTAVTIDSIQSFKQAMKVPYDKYIKFILENGEIVEGNEG